MKFWAWLSELGRPIGWTLKVSALAIVLGVYIVVAIGSAILGASLRKH